MIINQTTNEKKINSFFLLLRTLQYLKPGQIFYRILYRFCSPKILAFVIKVRDVNCSAITWQSIQPQTPFLTYPFFNSGDITTGNFKFLKQKIVFEDAIDWNVPDMGRLWRYNFHYFQYLHPTDGLDSAIGFRLMLHWIENNPPGTPDAWDSFPLSLRLVNWIKYLNENSFPDEIPRKLLKSIFQQTLWLESRLEYHLLGNHLFKNIKALVFAGLFFKGPVADRWLKKGLRLLEREIKEQILPDGGHFERSPMYHSMILEDCLDLLNVFLKKPHEKTIKILKQLQSVTDYMVYFLDGMTHPDGEIALFNDAAFGIESKPDVLIDYYERVTDNKISENKDQIKSFPDSGYYVITSSKKEYMVIDCGSVGPDYQPGHAHCDTLSFELSLKGKRVIVDSGCSQYEKSQIRSYNRGNAGHNTVTIDEYNQSEVWGAHRCGRRAYPLYANLQKSPKGLVFEGAHDGYNWLSGHPVHHRKIIRDDNFYLIEDRVEGEGIHNIESRLHVNPLFSVEVRAEKAVVRDGDEILLSITVEGEGQLESKSGWYCPEFGIMNPCIVISTSSHNVPLPFRGGWRLQLLN